MPFALASSANSRFQLSKPAAELPHWAALALLARQPNTAIAAHAAAAIFLPLIEFSLEWLNVAAAARVREPGGPHLKATFPGRSGISDRPPSQAVRPPGSDRWWTGRTSAGSPPDAQNTVYQSRSSPVIRRDSETREPDVRLIGMHIRAVNDTARCLPGLRSEIMAERDVTETSTRLAGRGRSEFYRPINTPASC